MLIAHELGWDTTQLDHYCAGEFDGRHVADLSGDELTKLAERLAIEIDERRREEADQAQAAAQ